MNILVQLKQLTNLTENEKILVDFILKHHERFLKMSAKQISQEVFVSNSTIYRLCQKLNLSGLSELKVQVSSSFNNFILEDHELDFNYPIKQHESQYAMVQKLKSIYEQTVINTQNLIDLETLRQVAFKIKKSKYIDIYTSAGNLYFAENFKFQMQEISRFVNVPVEEYHQRLTASSSNEEHLAIVISFEGRGYSIGDICHILFKQNTPIVLISSTHHTKLDQYASFHLFMSSNENHYNKISSFSTRLSLLYLLDCLYTCYFELDYQKNVELKLENYKRMQSHHKD